VAVSLRNSWGGVVAPTAAAVTSAITDYVTHSGNLTFDPTAFYGALVGPKNH
jgi:hypothetical protein